MPGNFAHFIFASAAAISAPVISTPLEAPGPNGPLQGTFTGEAGSGQPAVLIIPGSGPTDRDGNNPLGVKAATYRLLAEALAEKGIASARTDKRGMFGSSGAIPDANAVTIDDYVHDTRAWIDAIRARTGGGCVWLLGHSEGGLIALASAAGSSENICGLVLIATPGRRLSDVMKSQLEANPANAPLLGAAFEAIDTLAAGHGVDTKNLPPALMPLFRPEVQGFLISTFELDPAHLISNVSVPVLIVQGERDIQVSGEDAAALSAAQPDAQLVWLPGTNHVLKMVSSDSREANLAAYADPDLPLAPGVAEAIAGFIGSHSPGTG